MTLLEFLNIQVKEYKTSVYKVLYLRFKTLNDQLTSLYRTDYLPLYKYCKMTNIVDSFEQEGLNYQIFKYKTESPCSNFYFDLYKNDQVKSDKDILIFYKDIKSDLAMLQELNECINRPHFQRTYMNHDIYFYMRNFYENMTKIYELNLDYLFYNAITAIENNKAIVVEGIVE